jgi:hypothetical protein
MPDLDGIAATRQLSGTASAAWVLILTVSAHLLMLGGRRSGWHTDSDAAADPLSSGLASAELAVTWLLHRPPAGLPSTAVGNLCTQRAQWRKPLSRREAALQSRGRFRLGRSKVDNRVDGSQAKVAQRNSVGRDPVG